MISGAFPSEALSRPPTVGPRNFARASVASPINPARGTIASADARNTRIGLAPNQFRPIPIGRNASSQFRGIASLHRQHGSWRPRRSGATASRWPGRFPRAWLAASRSSATTLLHPLVMLDRQPPATGVFSVRPVLPASGPESRRRAGSPPVLPSIRPRTAALSRGIARATKAAGNTTPYEIVYVVW